MSFHAQIYIRFRRSCCLQNVCFCSPIPTIFRENKTLKCFSSHQLSNSGGFRGGPRQLRRLPPLGDGLTPSLTVLTMMTTVLYYGDAIANLSLQTRKTVLRILKMIDTSGFRTFLECAKIVFGQGFARAPLGELTALPQIISWFNEAYF